MPLNLINRASRMGTARLFLGGGRVWLVVTVVAWIFRFARWLASRGDADTLREELRPGETLLIEHSRDAMGKRPTVERI